MYILVEEQTGVGLDQALPYPSWLVAFQNQTLPYLQALGQEENTSLFWVSRPPYQSAGLTTLVEMQP